MSDVLVVKVNMFCRSRELNDIRRYILSQIENGKVVVLPAYCDAQIVPGDIEIRVEDLSGEKDKDHWWQMIQILPSSYNQKRTVMLNYEVLAGIYPMRKNHKLDEWVEFCKWIETLPYPEIIVGEKVKFYADGKEINL